MSLQLKQSAPLTYSLSATGGILEVFATALLAIIDAREKQGYTITPCKKRLAFVGNILFQILASLAGNLFATWFGPISIVAPIFFSAQLVANMVIFGFLLGLEVFTKDMEVGTYVMVIACVLLPVVGPDMQEDQVISELLSRWYAILWLIILVVAMIGSAFILMLCDVANTSKWKKEWARIVILIIARSSSFALNLSASRAMILEPETVVLVLSIVIKIVSGAIYSYAIIVQSTAVQQSKFVPLNAVSIMFIVAVSGILIWEDYNVVHSWIGYVCVFILFCMGSYLLLSTDAPLMTSNNPQYGAVNHLRQSLIPPSRRQSFVGGVGGSTNQISIDNGTDDDVFEEDEQQQQKEEEGPQTMNVQQSTLSCISEEDGGSVVDIKEGGDEDKDQQETKPSRTPTTARFRFSRRPPHHGGVSFRDAWKDVLHADERISTQREHLFIPIHHHHHHYHDNNTRTTNNTNNSITSPTSSDVRKRRLNEKRRVKSLLPSTTPQNQQQQQNHPPPPRDSYMSAYGDYSPFQSTRKDMVSSSQEEEEEEVHANVEQEQLTSSQPFPATTFVKAKKSHSLDPNQLAMSVDRAHTELAISTYDDDDDDNNTQKQQKQSQSHETIKENKKDKEDEGE